MGAVRPGGDSDGTDIRRMVAPAYRRDERGDGMGMEKRRLKI